MPHPWEVGDEHQRFKGHMHPVYDLTLCNKLDSPQNPITTPGQLRAQEADFVERRLLTLGEHHLPGSYDLDGLRAVHWHLFQDVYEWAGDLRTVNMARGRQSVAFLPVEAIAPAVRATAAFVADTDLLRGGSEREFPARLAQVYHEVNQAHPFREGNGRTQRAFVGALAGESGHRVDWTRPAELANDQASRLAREGDLGPLVDMFTEVVSRSGGPGQPGRSQRLRGAAFPSPARQGPRAAEWPVQAYRYEERRGQGPDPGLGR